MKPKESEAAAAEVAAKIRESSKEGKLVSGGALLGLMGSDASYSPEHSSSAMNPIEAAIRGSEDLKELAAPDGSPRYYSSHFMTQAYAMILLQKEGDHRRLMAETIRENSALYPRPVPLEIFTRPPFDLCQDEIAEHLERMADEGEYRDIASTVTSASRVFAYSTRHLEPDHASMLAEWLDVGQFENP